jgi:hypothetical protein
MTQVLQQVLQSVDVRASIVEKFRRDLIGPTPAAEDADLATERLKENPSRWYLAGFLAPADDPLTEDGGKDEDEQSAIQDDADTEVTEPADDGAGGAAGDAELPDAPVAKRRFLPSSIGLTVLLPPDVREIEARISWGDYRTEPPLPEAILLPDEPKAKGEDGESKKPDRPMVDWVRLPRQQTVRLKIVDGRGPAVVVPESAAQQRTGGGLTLETHSRTFTFPTPDGEEEVRALTVFLVNRRAVVHRFYADVSYVFQAQIDLVCPQGFRPRRNLSGYRSDDFDLRVADLHYRDLCEYAVGRNSAAAWDRGEEQAGHVTRVWTDALPRAEVERVAPNEDEHVKSSVTFTMETLAEHAASGGAALGQALSSLPSLYAEWIEAQRKKFSDLRAQRRGTAEKLVAEMETARGRILEGIDILTRSDIARTAFRFMNLAIAMAARRRNAGATGDLAAQGPPEWRPFQLAFILLNIAGLSERKHPDREIADLLFFPTGGGKTEAYLGLAAYVISHRRLCGPGLLGAGVAVIMRYTLRLLTLDQLSRAAGVICALELMRNDAKFKDDKGRRQLGDWPIEIGLWVGSDASPKRLGRTGDADQTTAVGRVRRYKAGQDKRAPAPIKTCPWCGTPFKPSSFSCKPNDSAPTNLEIRCVNTGCDFTRDRPLPILTVDEPIYRRLPAFLIATVDKFASLPWVGETGAFFGHVDRFVDGQGFYGAAEPGHHGRRFDNGWSLDPPDLIIQDELHLIAGPLGTVAGLYETAIDRLASRQVGEQRIRPKIIASTATVRRASEQIRALFDRSKTAIFPPPGIDRTDSFFARTVPTSQNPARLYVGIAAQGRGPKLVFLRALTTLLSAAQAQFNAHATSSAAGKNPADPYMTALCFSTLCASLAAPVGSWKTKCGIARPIWDRAASLGPEGQPFRRPHHQGADGNHFACFDR